MECPLQVNIQKAVCILPLGFYQDRRFHVPFEKKSALTCDATQNLSMAPAKIASKSI